VQAGTLVTDTLLTELFSAFPRQAAIACKVFEVLPNGLEERLFPFDRKSISQHLARILIPDFVFVLKSGGFVFFEFLSSSHPEKIGVIHHCCDGLIELALIKKPRKIPPVYAFILVPAGISMPNVEFSDSGSLPFRPIVVELSELYGEHDVVADIREKIRQNKRYNPLTSGSVVVDLIFSIMGHSLSTRR